MVRVVTSGRGLGMPRASLQNGAIRIEHLAAILRGVTDLGVVAKFPFTLLGREDIAENLEQRRLARAIGSNQHRPLQLFDFEIDPTAIDDQVIVGKMDVAERNDPLPAADRLWKF